MPIIDLDSQPEPLILVSGVSGFIGAHVARTLLERGYNVRGTIRSASKGQELAKLLNDLPGTFEFVVVEEVSREGAFDEAIRGVDAVLHLASPFILDGDESTEIIQPAVKGTLGILESIKKHGSDKVKRVIITSSTAAIGHPLPAHFSEEDWNTAAIKEASELGKKASLPVQYCASKALAEKAAWSFVSSNQPLAWDLVVLNFPFVFGPTVSAVKAPTGLGASAGGWYQTVMTQDAGGKSSAELDSRNLPWIDVRDAAEAQARALAKENAGGERIIVMSGPSSWQEWLDVANSLDPMPYSKHPLARGIPGSGTCSASDPSCTSEKAKRILGMSNDGEAEWKFKTKLETARDILIDYETRGW
ncbi:hypothetical protein V5O48_018312 [Marasmius crinis-equi]|uniref:NAD-dependent epimerase/dehydratase domain-containing protein n=1 Tax=Marasmius crinis-equi TaxID=585013 RepID=A0ABR3ELJ0_9AGAR